MDYHCRHCGEDLDGGDIYEVYLAQTGDPKKALAWAKQHGWSETNRLHFRKSVIVQPEKEQQWVECPKCKGKWPFTTVVPPAGETP